jgi:hypothetical protein
MAQKMYHVISPDGFPITCEPFASEREALSAIPVWCQRFKNQGYYSTSNRQKIPLKELPDYLEVVPAESEFSLGC